VGFTKTIHLLVVEDDPAYMYLIQKAFSLRLEETHWELITAIDGEKALDLLFEEGDGPTPLPDLVLLDWNLPKVSGSEVLERMKQHRNLKRIPILIFSASDADDDVNSAYARHANGYITKPNGSENLANVVRTIEDFWIAVAQLSKVTRPI
jgi:CheY-like chemotaxis protein